MNPSLFLRKISFNWALTLPILFLALTGVILLYSAAQGELEPWAAKQFYVILITVPMMFIISIMNINIFYRNAYLLYIVGIVLLVVAEILGHKAMGAQRWIRIGFINFQPSELMKLFLIMALARYFHDIHSNDLPKIQMLLLPLFLVLLPVVLVLKQPNLGTALIMLMVSGAIFFLAGVKVWKFLSVIAVSLISLPIIWQFMHDYQKKRVLTFLDPESDPLGAGYNILQSMIAIGSGGFFGKGFLNGTQSQLSFLPEKQTDFVFTILAEEFGFIGVLSIFLLSLWVIFYGYATSFTLKNQFNRLVVAGIIMLFGLHVIINTAMISGSIPVVGTPFPLFSFGGSNLITMLIGFAIITSAVNSQSKQLR